MNTRAAPPAHTVPVPDTADRTRACCGPAHGRSWDIPAGQVAPEQVELSFRADAYTYQLVHDLRAGRAAARDDSGNLLYLPRREGEIHTRPAPLPKTSRGSVTADWSPPRRAP